MSNIKVEGGFRVQILETMTEIRKLQAQHKSRLEELEQTANSAASFQGVDLKEFALDVDTLEFVERPKPPVLEIPEVVEPQQKTQFGEILDIK
jgi:hypothetical protein